MSEDVLKMANKYIKKPGTWTLDGGNTDALVKDLAAEVRELRAKLDSEASHRLSLCADNERFVAEIERLKAWWSHAFKPGCASQGWELQCSMTAPDGLRHCGYAPELHPLDAQPLKVRDCEGCPQFKERTDEPV